jgi:hypothetical protein
MFDFIGNLLGVTDQTLAMTKQSIHTQEAAINVATKAVDLADAFIKHASTQVVNIVEIIPSEKDITIVCERLGNRTRFTLDRNYGL